jgi:PAS domain S-box-containing protein
VVSDVFRAVEGFDAVALHVPIFKGSVFKGSIGILINFENLAHRYLEVIKIGETGYAWVVSRDGTLLYSPIPGSTGKSAFESLKDSSSLKVVVNEMLKGHQGAAQYTADKIGDRHAGPTRKYAVYMPVHIGTTFWSIAVVSDEQDVLSGLISFRNKLAFVIGALFVFGLVFSTLGAKAWLIVKEEQQRKLTEEKLRKSEARFRQVAEIAGEFIWEIDASGLYTYASPSVVKLLGFTPDELMGKVHFYDLFDPTVREELKAAAFKVFADRKTFREFRNPNISKSGRLVHLETSGAPMLDPSGNLVGYRGADMDVTARWQAEALQKQSQRLLAETEQMGRVGGWEFNIDTGRQTWTEETYHIHEVNLTYEPTVEKGINFYTPASRPVIERAVRRAIEQGEPFDLELEIVTAKGALRNVQARGRSDLEHRRIYGFFQDITERKQSELEILQQRNELTHLARVTMLGELAGSLAHELNQPLTAILSNAQAAQRFLLKNPADIREVRDILADIAAEDKRAGEIIRRLRLLLTKGEVLHQPLDLNEVVEEVLKLVRSDLVNQGAAAQTELAPNLPALQGDRVQLQQVLINLVMNACDAMAGAAREDRQLTIRTGLLQDDSVCLSVSDCGTGLAPDKLEQVFDPFYTTKPQGMGLGLVVCRTIITAHGGKLWATNNPERGATFHFTLLPSGKGQEPHPAAAR